MLATRRRKLMVLLGLVGIVSAIVAVILTSNQSTQSTSDWKSDWAVKQGFAITIDAQGFRFPSSIAFIPSPGNSPKSPLYFVTELRGKVKVVTQDRTVLTFAEDFFTLRPKRVNPTVGESVGMAGVCLAPNRGYVFVTFSYQDHDNILRNNIVRFQSSPKTFSISPTSQIDFTEVFAAFQAVPSHQIGACQVEDDLLYVSVGDGEQTEQSQQTDSLLGKVLRMTLDGSPVPDNPFYQDDDITKARNFVWAYGLRNPFGLNVVGPQVFVADNGPVIDRFLQVRAGGNYLWDGTDTSIGTNADAIFSPGRGVAQLERYPTGLNLFPSRFRDSFFMTMTGNPLVRREGIPAIWAIPYDLSQERMSAVPKPVLRYRGREVQIVAGMAFGPDGLYFAPLVPDDSGSSDVLKIRYAPEEEYPYTLETELNPVVLMNTLGCLACHSLHANQDRAVGPTLERRVLQSRLNNRLNSEEYERAATKLDELDLEPFVSFRDARNSVLQAQGAEKINLWLYNRLLEPRFDDPNATMPQLGLSSQQATAIAGYLSGESQEAAEDGEGRGPLSRVRDVVDKPVDWLERQLPYPTRENAKKYLAAFFAVGIGAGVLAAALVFWLVVYLHGKRDRKASEELESH